MTTTTEENKQIKVFLKQVSKKIDTLQKKMQGMSTGTRTVANIDIFPISLDCHRKVNLNSIREVCKETQETLINIQSEMAYLKHFMHRLTTDSQNNDR